MNQTPRQEPLRLLYPMHYRLTSRTVAIRSGTAKVIWIWQGDLARFLSLDAGIGLVGSVMLIGAVLELITGWSQRPHLQNVYYVLGSVVLCVAVIVAYRMTLSRLGEAIAISCLLSCGDCIRIVTFRPRVSPQVRELASREVEIAQIRLSLSERARSGLPTTSWAVVLPFEGIVVAAEPSPAEAHAAAARLLPSLPARVREDEFLLRGDRHLDQRVREIDENTTVTVWWARRMLAWYDMLPESLAARLHGVVDSQTRSERAASSTD